MAVKHCKHTSVINSAAKATERWGLTRFNGGWRHFRFLISAQEGEGGGRGMSSASRGLRSAPQKKKLANIFLSDIFLSQD